MAESLFWTHVMSAVFKTIFVELKYLVLNKYNDVAFLWSLCPRYFDYVNAESHIVIEHVPDTCFGVLISECAIVNHILSKLSNISFWEIINTIE